MISSNSLSLSPTLPKTRMMRLPPKNKVSPRLHDGHPGPAPSRSTCSSTLGGMPETTISRDTPRSRTAIALTPVAISTSSCTFCGISSGSACSRTTLTAAAVASRCSSHCRRKLATEGGKINSSAISTKLTVSNSSLVDSRRANGTAPGLLASAASGSSLAAVLSSIVALLPPHRPNTRMKRISFRSAGLRTVPAK